MMHRILFLLLALLSYSGYGQIRFLENKGQLHSAVKYYGDMKGGSVFLQEDGLVYSFHSLDTVHGESEDWRVPHKHSHNGPKKYCSYTVSFANSAYPRLKPGGIMPGLTNYYTGNDPTRWASGVRAFSEISFPWLYKGIDMEVYSQYDALKYDFIVSPGADPNQIALQFSGVDSLRIDSLGGLEIFTGFVRAYEYPPYAYQVDDSAQQRIIPSRYELKGNTVRFDIGKYNTSDTLIIDPSLIFSTYTGSQSDNWGSSATYDEAGNAYTSGLTEIGVPGYPTELGKLQFIHGGGDGYLEWDLGLMKVDASGHNMVYATYFGGNGSDCPHSMVVNSKGELLVFGTTGSSDLPGAINDFSGGSRLSVGNFLDFDNGVDMFVAHFGLNGELIRSRYLGGSDNDGINYHSNLDPRNILVGNDSLYYNYGDWARGEIGVDPADNIYIGSTTRSADFPASRNAFSGGMDGIVSKLSPALSPLWSMYVGGNENDAIYSIDVDKDGAIYATGGTSSKNLQTNSSAYRRDYLGGATDGFLAKFNTVGDQQGLTYFGSSAYDQSYFVRLDKSKSVYIFGQTRAPGSELIFNAGYNRPNSGQFIAKFKNDLSSLEWSTVFGTGSGKPNISPTAFSVDLCNRVYLSGSGREWPRSLTNYEWIPALAKYRSVIEGTNGMEITSDAHQSATDGIDFYIMVMYDDASALDYATFLGEVRSTETYFRADALGRVYWDADNDRCGDDHVDGGTSRFDRRGNVYQSVCASCQGCNGFPIAPIPGAFRTHNGSDNCNNAVAKFNIHSEFLTASFTAYPNPCTDKEIRIKNNSTWVNVNEVRFEWDFGNGTTSAERDPQIVYSDYGQYRIRLIAKDISSCNLIDTAYMTVTVAPTLDPILEEMRICSGDTVSLGFQGFADTSFRYYWSPSTYLLDTTVANPKAVVYESISYTLVAKSSYCERIFEQNIDVVGGNLDVKISIVGKDSSLSKVCIGDNISLLATSNRKTVSYEWSWTPDFSSRINLSLSDSILRLQATHNQTIYLRAMGAFCEGMDIDTFDIKISEPVILVEASNTAVCKEGTATLWAYEALGDTLQYVWSPANIIDGANDTDTVTAMFDRPQTMRVLATDRYGCTHNASIRIDVDTLWLEKSAVSFISCYNSGDGAISVHAEGYPPYQYLWSDSPVSASMRENLQPGEYSLTVTDALGCINDTVFRLDNPLPLTFSYILRHQSCQEVCNGMIDIQTEGGTAPILLYFNDSLIESAHLGMLCQTFFTIKATDRNGCSTVQYGDIQIKEDLPILEAYTVPAEVIMGQQTELHAAPDQLLSDSVLYLWTPSHDIITAQGASALAIPLKTTEYVVAATDKYGCTNTDTVTVSVKEYICGDPFIYIPNAFSPNADGVNDRFMVQSKVLEQFTILVFNRWGQIVWQTSDPKAFWDGTFDGELLSPAVFDFYLKGTCFNKEAVELKGNIHLIR